MKVREYLSVRRAFGPVRQSMPAPCRITFEELAILCHLEAAGTSLRTSEVADYQRVFRPTMTHRSAHLAKLGLIVREVGGQDRRIVCCAITPEGRRVLDELLAAVRARITPPMPLCRCTTERLRLIVDEMGRLSLTSADLVLLGLAQMPGGSASVSDLVLGLGLLQPTVSMAVAALAAQGLVVRAEPRAGGRAGQAPHVELAPEGVECARELEAQVADLRPARGRRA